MIEEMAAPPAEPPTPAESAPPATPATSAAAPLTLVPQTGGGAEPQPRRRITWKGAEGAPAPGEHVTVLKLG